MRYFINCLIKYADFNGRSRRKEYWMFSIFASLLCLLPFLYTNTLGILFDSIIYDNMNNLLYIGGEKILVALISYSIIFLALLTPWLAVTSRRLHDMGFNFAWYIVLLLIPFASYILFFENSEETENRWGPNPKTLETSNFMSSCTKHNNSQKTIAPQKNETKPKEKLIENKEINDNQLKQENIYSPCNYYHNDSIEKDYKKAFESKIESAEDGDANTQFEIGNCYYYGDGVTIDYEKAIEWWTKSAEQGNINAQFNLGKCYCNGYGTEKNHNKAVEWWLRSAEQGNADAQFSLGICYYYGDGVEIDYEESVKWYTMAAKLGHADAQNALGGCYYHGKGVEMDRERAFEWYVRAAKQGEGAAEYAIKKHYPNRDY